MKFLAQRHSAQMDVQTGLVALVETPGKVARDTVVVVFQGLDRPVLAHERDSGQEGDVPGLAIDCGGFGQKAHAMLPSCGKRLPCRTCQTAQEGRCQGQIRAKKGGRRVAFAALDHKGLSGSLQEGRNGPVCGIAQGVVLLFHRRFLCHCVHVRHPDALQFLQGLAQKQGMEEQVGTADQALQDFGCTSGTADCAHKGIERTLGIVNLEAHARGHVRTAQDLGHKLKGCGR